jgi:N-acyl-phosphatidylethanolamine-hydrolysing phospholipase D
LAVSRLAACVAGLALCLGACASPPDDPAAPHHARDGFRNTTGAQVDKPFSWLLRWKWEAWRAGLPQPPRQATPVVAPQLRALLRNNRGGRMGQPSATWIGHATVLVQSGGLNILTDPVFGERASPLSFAGPLRAQPPGIALSDLPPIDVVLVSHNHYDHLDRGSVMQLNARSQGQTLFLVPLGLKAFFADAGIANVIELEWWDVRRVAGIDFQLVPVQHWSARSLWDRNETLWGGWAVFAPDLRWYFSGDTGYSRYFRDTRERLAAHERDGTLFDLALLAIGAYEPRWFMREQHMDPAQALQARSDLGARRAIGIHWGTFQLTDEALDQPPRDLAAARGRQGVAEQDFFVLPIGGTWWSAGSPAAAPKQ